MPVYDTTVQSVTSRVVNKKAGGTTTIYEVIDSAGNKWATFKNTIANEANRLINQAVQIQGRIEQNGSYQNYYLDDIRELPTSSRPQTQERFVEQARQAQPPQQSAPIGRQQEQGPTEPTDRDWAIMRQTAGKVSASISENPKDFWANLDSLLTYFAYGLKPPEFEGTQGNVLQHPDGREPNQFIPESAYNDPGRDSPFPDTDSDIPF